MEIFLNLWDELDDLAHACRHIATSFALEAVALSRPRVMFLLTAATVLLSWPVGSKLASLKNLI
jgi:hypothetical protein